MCHPALHASNLPFFDMATSQASIDGQATFARRAPASAYCFIALGTSVYQRLPRHSRLPTDRERRRKHGQAQHLADDVIRPSLSFGDPAYSTVSYSSLFHLLAL